MRKLISIILTSILSTGLVSCGSQSNTPAATTNQTEVASKEKIYSAGEEAFMTNDKGEKIYSLTINSVVSDDNFQYKEYHKDAKQIVKVNYTYKNIAKNDNAGLRISLDDLQVVDEEGSVYQTLTGQDAQYVGTGINNTVTGDYGLAHKSSKVKVVFKSTQYKKTLTFEVDVK